MIPTDVRDAFSLSAIQRASVAMTSAMGRYPGQSSRKSSRDLVEATFGRSDGQKYEAACMKAAGFDYTGGTGCSVEDSYNINRACYT